jgi:hypothetical protein
METGLGCEGTEVFIVGLVYIVKAFIFVIFLFHSGAAVPAAFAK